MGEGQARALTRPPVTTPVATAAPILIGVREASASQR